MNLASWQRAILPAQEERLTLAAHWVGSAAHSRLEESGEGTVTGVFDRAVNIALPRGLVCLVTEGVERGPLNVTMRLPNAIPTMSSFGLRNGDRVRVHNQSLLIGDGLRVSFASARLYQPGRELARRVVEDDKIAANLEAMRKSALLFGSTQGLGELLVLLQTWDEARAGTLNIFASAALPRLVRLEEGFLHENEDMMKEAVGDLIGLGPGLTPSSDDLLGGMLLICSFYSEKLGRATRAARFLADATAAAAHGRTTVVSAEYLRQAALGMGNEPVSRLCGALLTRGVRSVERETRRVLAIGGTSGTDIVLGIVLGAMLCNGERTGLTRREYH